MEDIASFCVWVMIFLLMANAGMGIIGDMPFFKDNGLNPNLKPYSPSGAVSGTMSFLAGLIDSATSINNYSSSTTPTISTDSTPKFDSTQKGLFTKLVDMFYSWNRIAQYFANAIGPMGAVIWIFTSFVEVVQLIGLFVLFYRVATIAKMFIPFGG